MHKVCVVVPCYNEGARLHKEEILAYLGTHADAGFCFVDDGSLDNTLSVLNLLSQAEPDRVRVLSLARNGGKAEAIRQGVMHVAEAREFDFIGYWDADLATPLVEIDNILHEFDQETACVLVMGSRVKRLGSRIERTSIRHILGRVFATWASRLLNLPVYDSQCGAKIFRADSAGLLFNEPFVTKWLFDVELIARLRNHLGGEGILNAVLEMPLRAWTDVSGSKMRLAHYARVPLDVLRIDAHYNRKTRSREPAVGGLADWRTVGAMAAGPPDRRTIGHLTDSRQPSAVI